MLSGRKKWPKLSLESDTQKGHRPFQVICNCWFARYLQLVEYLQALCIHRHCINDLLVGHLQVICNGGLKMQSEARNRQNQSGYRPLRPDSCLLSACGQVRAFRPLGQAASRPLCKLGTSEVTPQQVTIAVAVETFWCGESSRRGRTAAFTRTAA